MKKLILCFAMLLGYQITPALADEDTTEERLMFRYRLATDAELKQLHTERNIKLKAAVVVTQILPGFPSAKINLSTDDLVLSLNGQTISTYEAIEKFVAKRKPEEEIKIFYIDLHTTKPDKSSGGEIELIPVVKKTATYKLSAVKPPDVSKPSNPSGTSTTTTPPPAGSNTTSPPVAKHRGIITEFDKFKNLYSIKDQKEFSLIKIKLCPKVLTASLSTTTEKPATSLPTISLYIISMNTEWQFLRKPDSLAMTVIIDNKDRFEVKCEHRFDKIFQNGTCFEGMWFILNEQQSKAFAAAKKIEAQLAFSEFEFPKEFPAHVKQFVEELQKYVSAPAAP